MPLFGGHKESTSPTTTSTSRHGTLSKGSRHDRDISPSRRSDSPSHKKTGFFSRDRRSSSLSSSDRDSYRTGHTSTTRATSRSNGGGFLGFGKDKHSLHDDPSILNARQTVADAEQAERDADKALVEARNRVRLAREHVKIVEQEAVEE